MTERPDDGFTATMDADVRAGVTCHEPCVPECTREHPWEQK